MLFAAEISTAAGSFGGISTAQTRAGLTLRARRPHRRQPTAAQTIQRYRLATLPSIWRGLAGSQRQAWNTAAAETLSGYTLFCKLHRNLQTLGITAPLVTPPQAPNFPVLRGLYLAPLYSAAQPPWSLTSWIFQYSVETPSPFTIALRATSSHSTTTRVFPASAFRLLSLFAPTFPGSWPINVAWVNAYGVPPLTGAIAIDVSLMDPQSGYESKRTRLSATWAAEAIAFPNPGALIIDVNGAEIATIPQSAIFVNGQLVAGQ